MGEDALKRLELVLAKENIHNVSLIALSIDSKGPSTIGPEYVWTKIGTYDFVQLDEEEKASMIWPVKTKAEAFDGLFPGRRLHEIRR